MADEETLSTILGLKKGNPSEFLQQLGLNGVPSNEQLQEEIEEEILVPKTETVSQLLDQFQMYDLRVKYLLSD
jgi:hypothetical protein